MRRTPLRRCGQILIGYCVLLPAGASAAFCAAGPAAAFGSATGLSDLEFRYVMTSARSLPRGRPAKPIEVPGMKPFGLVRKALRSSTVHLPGFAFMPAE